MAHNQVHTLTKCALRQIRAWSLLLPIGYSSNYINKITKFPERHEAEKDIFWHISIFVNKRTAELSYRNNIAIFIHLSLLRTSIRVIVIAINFVLICSNLSFDIN